MTKMNLFSPVLWLIAFRNLMQHRIRSGLIALVIAGVSTLMIALTGVTTGMKDTLILSATTLMSGHVNVAGFFKSTTSQAAPVVTEYQKILDIVKAEVPELDYAVHRGRGFAKLISDSASMQTVIGAIDIKAERGFRQVIVLKSGNLDDLARPDALLLFEEQANKLGVKVGDKLTFAAPTPRGTNNTIDVTVVAIATNLGLISSFSSYVNEDALRKLYQLNEESTGALQLYLKDVKDVPKVQERLRKSLAAHGYTMMDPDPRPFFVKFQAVNNEDWTGQKLDVTTWEEETSFVQFFVLILTVSFTVVIFLLVVIIGVGIMNVMWIAIRERTREIGTLRAVGMQRSSVLWMFLVEGFLTGVLGTVPGVLVGLGAAALINGAHIHLPKGAQLMLMNDHLVVTPSLFWAVFSVAFITGIITVISIFPSFRAAQLKPITAMSQVG
jgi:putative ABC transport system permease protein